MKWNQSIQNYSRELAAMDEEISIKLRGRCSFPHVEPIRQVPPCNAGTT